MIFLSNIRGTQNLSTQPQTSSPDRATIAADTAAEDAFWREAAAALKARRPLASDDANASKAHELTRAARVAFGDYLWAVAEDGHPLEGPAVEIKARRDAA